MFLFQLSRPKRRRHTLVFSRHACILSEDNCLTMQIRVGDMRRTHLIDSRVHGVLVKRYVVHEKYVYPLYQHQVLQDGKRDKIYLLNARLLLHRQAAEILLNCHLQKTLIYVSSHVISVILPQHFNRMFLPLTFSSNCRCQIFYLF